MSTGDEDERTRIVLAPGAHQITVESVTTEAITDNVRDARVAVARENRLAAEGVARARYRDPARYMVIAHAFIATFVTVSTVWLAATVIPGISDPKAQAIALVGAFAALAGELYAARAPFRQLIEMLKSSN